PAACWSRIGGIRNLRLCEAALVGWAKAPDDCLLRAPISSAVPTRSTRPTARTAWARLARARLCPPYGTVRLLRLRIPPHHPAFEPRLRCGIAREHQRIMAGHDVRRR